MVNVYPVDENSLAFSAWDSYTPAGLYWGAETFNSFFKYSLETPAFLSLSKSSGVSIFIASFVPSSSSEISIFKPSSFSEAFNFSASTVINALYSTAAFLPSASATVTR